MRQLSPLTSLLLTLACLFGFSFAVRVVDAANPTTAALGLLVIVLAAATVSRPWVAIVSSVAAALCLNYFFVPPVGTFIVADAHNVVSLVAFVIVGVVASRLSATARARGREAEARRSEAELVRQRADLASALLASLSHDLRTPLTAISVAVENLDNDAMSAEQRRTQVQLAKSEVQRLNRLFRGILDMARIETAAVPIQREWVTAADVVDAACVNVKPALEGRQLRIEADESTAVLVDPRLTSAALSHLLENAAQYSPPDAPIDVQGRVTDEGLHLSVHDRGPGIDCDDLPYLFDRFYRGKRGAATTPGSGMGLAITRGLLAAEQGRVWGENAQDEGAVFSIVVPAARRPVSAEV